MKKILSFIIIMLFSSFVFSQELKFDSIIDVPGANQDQLYQRARGWYADYWKSEKDVLSIQDKETGELSGNAVMSYNPSGLAFFGVLATRGDVAFKINIYVKDGKYRNILHSFIHKGTDLGGGPKSYGLITQIEEPPRGHNKKGWNHIKTQVENYAGSLAMDLDKAMKSQAKTENW